MTFSRAGSEGGGTVGDIVLFEVAKQRYGLPVSHVREVLPLATITPLPGAPEGLMGLLRVRGSLLPVVDLRRRLGLSAARPALGQCIVVMMPEAGGVGLLVDGAYGITSGHSIPVQEAASTGAQLLNRVVLTSGEMVAVLDARAVIGLDLQGFLPAVAMSSGTTPQGVDSEPDASGAG